ncbi:MAG TPA: hypothetical protein VM115_12945 [Vicinamibacterales bacterium]|nr:hypothetical protein [Vicinamibacterales bacterium]
MVPIRPGDLIAISQGQKVVLFAVLTKQILLGGHWSYVFHGVQQLTAISNIPTVGTGFNAGVDFIIPRREGRILRISRNNDFSRLTGSELLQQEPARGEENYRIWRWLNGRRDHAEWVRSTPSPTAEERAAPHWECIPADDACELAKRRWEPHLTRVVLP